jgi:anti-sigma B factor antagonist
MSDFDLTIEHRGDFVLVALSGELDISTGLRLQESLERIAEEKPERIVIDLRGLQFMDSTGLRILIGADARAREEGRHVALVRGNDMVQRVLQVTRLDEQLEIVDGSALSRAAG